MFQEDKFLPKIKSSQDQGGDFEKEKNNESEELSNEIVDFVIDNYLDEEGNFDWWESFGEKKIDSQENLMENTKKILADQEVVFDDFEYTAFETFMFQEKTFQKIFHQYKQEKNLLRKIKIIKLYGDLSLDFARSSQGERDSYNFFKKLKGIADDLQESYLIRTYAKINYFENFDYYLIDNRVDDERFEEDLDVCDMHDASFNDIKFSFDRETIRKFINNRVGQYGYGDICKVLPDC